MLQTSIWLTDIYMIQGVPCVMVIDQTKVLQKV